MNLTQTKQTLNDHQYQAVTLESNKNALILAGAGSGKTRILTQRIAYLCDEKAVQTHQILSVTFTNKAASEMKQRLQTLLKQPVGAMWIGTFHGLAYRLLQAHFKKNAQTNLAIKLQIIDPQDQLRIIKDIIKTMALDEKKFVPQKIRHFINAEKDEGHRPNSIAAGHHFFAQKSQEIYQQYQQHCDTNHLLDFGDILLKSYELLRDNQAVRLQYQQQFSHILIDEFQDTNHVQYQWIKLLHTQTNYLFCVGDDDQSIYGWRGAKIENIHHVQKDFAPIMMIRLEQNYRSTGHILNASNALISNNSQRLGKTLWTDSGDGDKIDIFQTIQDKEEVSCVVSRIQQYIQQGISPQDCAVLYRTNAQSRLFEEGMIAQSIAYEIYGGLRFFERAEIKNALCYLRLVLNPYDDIAFLRVVNMPPRGIGVSSIEQLQIYANTQGLSLWQASKQIDSLSTRASNALALFSELINDMIDKTSQQDLTQTLGYLINMSNLKNYYIQGNKEFNKSKVANLEELISATIEYQQANNEVEDSSPTIIKQTFIDNTSLDSASEQKDSIPSVQLMTIHSAKGLEFAYVFVVGMEEGLFPSMQSQEDPKLINEERRLCYVAMTRAMKKLHLSYAKKRFLWGKESFLLPSKFLSELPAKHLTIIKSPKLNQSYDFQNKPNFTKQASQILGNDTDAYQVGDKVVHDKFGIGVVLNYEGKGQNERVEINFKQHGKKWLILAYAKVVKLS